MYFYDKQYAEKFHQDDDYVIAAHCVHYTITNPEELITSTKDEEKIRKVFEEDEKRILSVLNDIEALLAENKISGDVVRLGGQPETSILAKAEEVQAAMIVMGSRGLGTIRRTILGSVKYVKTLHQADKYVIAALCAEYTGVDSGGESAGVLSITQAGFDVIEGLLQEDEKRILSTLNDIESLLIENQLEGEVIRLEGIPGVAIISKAREVNASMIVIGSRGFGRIRRTLMGSVSNFVVHHSPVPVALCKYEKRATEVP
uniref:Stress response protein nhaX n=1 Tax=Magallana gigas TaxID=29159 RepID=K1QQ19_MAGGI